MTQDRAGFCPLALIEPWHWPSGGLSKGLEIPLELVAVVAIVALQGRRYQVRVLYWSWSSLNSWLDRWQCPPALSS